MSGSSLGRAYTVVTCTLFAGLAVMIWCLQSAVAHDVCDTLFGVLWILLAVSQMMFVIIAWWMKTYSQTLPASSRAADSPTLVMFVAVVVLLVVVGFFIFLAYAELPS
jgi:hypothetical protein